MQDRFLVTGGAGYVGSHLVALLAERGASVVILDNLRQGHRAAIPPGARLIEGDAANVQTLDAVLAVGEAAIDALPTDALPVEGEAAPAGATAETATEEADRAKRRGRRGGRRRRRDGTEEAGDAEAAAPATPAYVAPAYSPPAYTGPTPADPFGGTVAFDIFDAIEQAEQERALAAFAPAPAPLAPAVDAVAEAGLPVIDQMQVAEPVVVLPEMVSVAEPDPAPEAPVEAPQPTVTETPASEPAAVESLAAEAPELAPAIVPVLVGDAEPAEKKRGWWKR